MICYIKSIYSQTCLKRPLKKDKIKVLSGSLIEVESIAHEHSAILLTCIKQLQVLKTYILSSFEWLLKTGLTVYPKFLDCA